MIHASSDLRNKDVTISMHGPSSVKPSLTIPFRREAVQPLIRFGQLVKGSRQRSTYLISILSVVHVAWNPKSHQCPTKSFTNGMLACFGHLWISLAAVHNRLISALVGYLQTWPQVAFGATPVRSNLATVLRTRKGPGPSHAVNCLSGRSKT